MVESSLGMHRMSGDEEDAVSKEGTGAGEDADAGVVIDALADTGAEVAMVKYTMCLKSAAASGLSASQIKTHPSEDIFSTLGPGRC